MSSFGAYWDVDSLLKEDPRYPTDIWIDLQDPHPEDMSLAEASSYTGLPKDILSFMVNEKILPSSTVNGALRLQKDDIDRWCEEQFTSSSREIAKCVNENCDKPPLGKGLIQLAYDSRKFSFCYVCPSCMCHYALCIRRSHNRLIPYPTDEDSQAYSRRQEVSTRGTFDEEPQGDLVVWTAAGEDRPGIMEELTKAFYDNHCNIEGSNQTILESVFTLILIVRVPDSTGQKLEHRLQTLANELGITIKPYGKSSTSRAARNRLPYVLEVCAVNRPGVLHQISHVLATNEANITGLQTDIYPKHCLVDAERVSMGLIRLSLQVPLHKDKSLRQGIEEVASTMRWGFRLRGILNSIDMRQLELPTGDN